MKKMGTQRGFIWRPEGRLMRHKRVIFLLWLVSVKDLRTRGL